MNDSYDQTSGLEIAVIGLAGRFPGAKNVDEFWQNLRDGLETISFFTDEDLAAEGIDPAVLNNPNYVKASGTIEDIDKFDASFFGFSAREAEITDPQHRIFLECAWEALESAGYNPEKYHGSIGVYAGISMSTYLLNIYTNPDIGESLSGFQIMLANDKDYLPTRVSYKLNLKGPSVAIQTACSTSLVSVHLACQSLNNGECKMALAGGVSVRVPQKSGYFHQQESILSPDGHCRAFDANAQGTVGSSGLGIVVLKRLEDALADGDCIHAVIKGSAINNDGFTKVSYTAPSVEGQAEVITLAQAIADVDARSISYIEAHGTGTALGDPIELAALQQAFAASTNEKQFCAIGSVKTNIGHLDAAAGIAGLIKTVLALKHRQIPASLHFRQANPKIDFENSPFYVNTELSEWRAVDGVRRAGVSSFGIGGTNAHVILEQAPDKQRDSSGSGMELLVLSARTERGLEQTRRRLAERLMSGSEENLSDVAYTLQVGRKEFGHRLALVSRSVEETVEKLMGNKAKGVHTGAGRWKQVVYMFPGQGSQYVNMGKGLYNRDELYRAEVDKCAEILKEELGIDIREVLYPKAGEEEEAKRKLKETRITQPALFVVQYAIAEMLKGRGIEAEAMIGHSIGEYVAAHIAGVFSLEDGLRMVTARGEQMQRAPRGKMMAVMKGEDDVKKYLRRGIEVAAVNGPGAVVVSGRIEEMEEMARRLDDETVGYRILETSHGFHSGMMEEAAVRFIEEVKKVKLKEPMKKYISNVSGRWIKGSEAVEAKYWARQMREKVRFWEGIEEIRKMGEVILVEVGPGSILGGLVRRGLTEDPRPELVTTLGVWEGEESEEEKLESSIGKIWVLGGDVEWERRYEGKKRRRVELPTYPFERERYWIEGRTRSSNRQNNSAALPEKGPEIQVEENGPGKASNNPGISENKPRSSTAHSRPSLETLYVPPRNDVESVIAETWQELLGIEPVGINDNFFELGGDSLLAIQVISSLHQRLQVEFVLHTFFESPTVAKMAKLIGGTLSADRIAFPKTEQSVSPLLVEIQPGGPRPPLFFIHAVGGSVFLYRELAQYLGTDQPVYGIMAQGLDGETEPYIRVEDMAAHYIKVVSMVQPDEPYFLAGASFGGSLTFEMARQLDAQGKKLALVALMDTPGQGQMPEKLEDDAAILVYLAGDINLSLPHLRQLTLDEQLIHVLEQMKSANRLPLEMELSQAKRILRVWRANYKAMWSYVPQRFAGRVTFFRASDRGGGFAPNPEIPWIELSAGGVEVHISPGNHHTMLSQPHVQVLAQQMKRSLDNAFLNFD